MELIIRNVTNHPIYDQIYSQIKAQIIAGQLRPGEALPSIRALAKDLKISVITTKRAYDELESEGLIDTVAGKGCFVAEKNLDLIREQQLRELEGHLSAAAALGDAGSPASDSTLGPTSGLNADGQHNHIWDTCVPTFIHFNIPLMLAAIIFSQFI